MIDIQFPEFAYKIKNENGKDIIFDECRKQWMILTPEEWVRQNFLQYLLLVKKYPMSLIAVEKEIKLEDLRKRFDLVVYQDSKPWMIVECKEQKVQLDETVIRQILNYNITLQAQYLVITNGKSTFALQLKGKEFQWMDALPDF